LRSVEDLPDVKIERMETVMSFALALREKRLEARFVLNKEELGMLENSGY